VQHYTGPLVEENAYYPFGLVAAGISSKAAGRLQNKEKTFQGQRFDDELGLNWVQFKWRNNDPQIGRFIEIDPLANDYVYNSTYAFSENKVTGHVELEGLEAVAFGVSAGLAGEFFPPILIGYVAYRILEANAPSQAQIEAANAHNALQSGGVVGMNGFTMGTTTTAGQSYAKPGQAAAPALTTGAAAGIKNLVVQMKGAQDAKKVPNPNGKKGGEPHQKEVEAAKKDLKQKGYDVVQQEVKVQTPGGDKKNRYIDVQGTNSKTGETQQVQVGKQNKNGTPVSRERKALDDVEKATGKRPEFIPYNKQ
jgi:RHS repeat-associated protein